MPSISKEEILKKIHAKRIVNFEDVFRMNPSIIESAYDAMDLWAKIVAIGFAAYIGKVLDGEVRIPKNKENHTKWDELFELYLKSIQ